MEQQNETPTEAPKSLPAITIARYDADPTALGVIRPADDSWQLVIDKDGYPVFYFRVQAEDGETGLMCVDDVLPPEMDGVKGLMQGTFGEPCTEEEAEKAHAEFMQRIEAAARPCPR
jgi:hypothetical protein